MDKKRKKISEVVKLWTTDPAHVDLTAYLSEHDIRPASPDPLVNTIWVAAHSFIDTLRLNLPLEKVGDAEATRKALNAAFDDVKRWHGERVANIVFYHYHKFCGIDVSEAERWAKNVAEARRRRHR